MTFRDDLIAATGVDPDVLDKIAFHLVLVADEWREEEHDLWKTQRGSYWQEVSREQVERFAKTLWQPFPSNEAEAEAEDEIRNWWTRTGEED